MSRSAVDKENVVCSPVGEAAALKGSSRPRKRSIAEVDGGVCLEQFVGKAKRAIKRGCTELGIRKYASLSSMSAKHAQAADGDGDVIHSRPRKPAVRSARSAQQDPPSEATIIVLSSDGGVGADAEADLDAEADTATHDDTEPVALESQLTLVAPSSPVRILGKEDPDALASELPDFVVDVLPPTSNHDDNDDDGDDEGMPSTYAELSDWLRSLEQQYSSDLEHGLAKHPELSGRMRPILVDWLMEVAADYRMHRQTLHLTVQYLDRFLANTDLQIEPSMLQCYGTACLSVAMKAEEQRVPTLSELTDFSKDAFSRDQLKKAEIDVLVALKWHLAVPTMFEFLSLMFQRAALQFPEQFADLTMPADTAHGRHALLCPATIPRRFDARQFIGACDHADALLHFQDSLRYSASELAAACFYLGTAPNSLEGPAFELCTGYAFSEVWPAILHAKYLRAALNPVSARSIRAKQCCETKDRHANHLRRIRPSELWTHQPHHAHLLGEFEDYFSAR